jgi:hypothetical protein
MKGYGSIFVFGNHMTERFTYEILMGIAEDAMINYKQAPIGFKSEYYKQYEDALICAEHMLKNKILSLPYVGPFGIVNIKRGDLVNIEKGSSLFTTHPKYKLRRDNPVAGKTYRVRVFNVTQGYITESWGRASREMDRVPKSPEIHWVGSGGYWFWTDISNVKLHSQSKQI